MTTITHAQAFEMMSNSTQFFTVTFIKRTTGESRTMNCRIGVQKYTNGVGMKYDPIAKNLLPVWERKYDGREGKECYRSVPMEGVTSLTINNEQYTVE